MIDYSIDLDAGPVVKKLKKLGADMPKINRKILGLLSEETITNAQQVYMHGPFGGSFIQWRSGKLAQSLTYKVHDDYADVGSNLVYAAIHEYGGTILPKKGKYLVFNIDGQTIFAKKVVIPKRPYLAPALDNLFKSGRAQMLADRELQRQLDQRMA